MNILQNLLIAFRALSINKMRSALTILGIVIGVSAVISLMSLGRGTQSAVTSRFEDMGTNLLIVRPGSTQESGVRTAAGTGTTLTLEDAEAIAQDEQILNYVAGVAPEASTYTQVVAAGQNVRTRVVGVTPEYETVRNFPVAEGEFITDEDLRASAMVAVLGSAVAANIFPDSDPVGQTVRISGRQFTVIGVLKSKGAGSLGTEDDIILTPISTLQNRIIGQRTTQAKHSVQTIYIQVVNASQMQVASDQIAALLRERHRITGNDDFTISSQEQIVQSLKETTNIFTLFLGALAGISLLVGGIGIMNIMLVSVTERTREIGIRRAVGAKRRHIMAQFIVEAAALSIAGGGIGIAAGWGISELISRFKISGQTLQTLLTPDILVLAIVVSLFIGLFFGIYPASRAAGLSPIDALRRE